MDAFSWLCPFCRQHASITNASQSSDFARLPSYGVDGHKVLVVSSITCPNTKCRKSQLQAWLYPADSKGSSIEKVGNKHDRYWSLIPDSTASVFPDYVPEGIREDYTEACKIAALSPKAAATLARRAIQGMIRDVWKVKKKNLAQAIEAIKRRVDPEAWKAIDGVRTVGNIGAHMEKDVNLIVSVDPKEAELLLRLIEALVEDWYVKPHERQVLYAGVTAIAQTKVAAKKGGSQATASAPPAGSAIQVAPGGATPSSKPQT
jgi:hypothetical protein